MDGKQKTKNININKTKQNKTKERERQSVNCSQLHPVGCIQCIYVYMCISVCFSCIDDGSIKNLIEA